MSLLQHSDTAQRLFIAPEVHVSWWRCFASAHAHRALVSVGYLGKPKSFEHLSFGEICTQFRQHGSSNIHGYCQCGDKVKNAPIFRCVQLHTDEYYGARRQPSHSTVWWARQNFIVFMELISKLCICQKVFSAQLYWTYYKNQQVPFN